MRKNVNLKVKYSMWVFLILALALLIGAPIAALHAVDKTGISGVVTQASGQPAVGAFVQAKNVDKGITTTVISTEGGHFTLANLGPGKYTVRSIGGGFVTAEKDPVNLSAGQELKTDLSLSVPESFTDASTESNEMRLLPEGDEKAFILKTCGLCHAHGFQEILRARHDHDGWMNTIATMRNHPYGRPESAQVTDAERDTLVAYLFKNLNTSVPPFDEKKGMPPNAWVTGPAAKMRVVEFDLPSGAYPHDVDVDSHGIVWVSERSLGYVGRLDPSDFSYTRYRVPGEKVELSDSIQLDPEGHPWMVDSGDSTIYEFDPATKSFNAFPYKPEPGQQDVRGRSISANTIQFTPDGTMWFTSAGKKIGEFDPRTKKITLYSSEVTGSGGPYGMAVDGAGVVWFPNQNANTVGKINPTTHEVTTYNPPTADSIPRRMGTDWNGDPWFAEFGAAKLVKIDYHTAKMTEYPTPTEYSVPYSVDTDKVNHFVWVNECFADQIARFDPRTDTFVEFPLPDHHLSIRRISVDPSHPTRVWFGEPNKDRVGYVEVMK